MCSMYVIFNTRVCMDHSQLFFIAIIISLLLPSDNVQHHLQDGSLSTFPKEENLGNNRKPMHQVYLPSVPTFGFCLLYLFAAYLLLPSQYVLSLNPKLHPSLLLFIVTVTDRSYLSCICFFMNSIFQLRLY